VAAKAVLAIAHQLTAETRPYPDVLVQPARMRVRFQLNQWTASSAAILMIAVTLVGVVREVGFGRLSTPRGALGVLVIALIHTPLALCLRARTRWQRVVCGLAMVFGAYLVTAFLLQEVGRITGSGARPLLALAWLAGVVAYGMAFRLLLRRAPTL
jgi:hypothetical protein